MQLNRSRAHMVGHFGLAVSLILTLMLPACVSVKESGDQETHAATALSSVMFQSIPGEAEVYVNGDFRGTTPLNLRLTAGTHTVALRLKGYATWQRELVVVAGDDTRLAARLEPE